MKDALRFLLRTPRFTVACSVIVALGVALSTLLFAVVKATLLDPWPYAGADRIVTIRSNYPEHGRERFELWSAAEVSDLAAQTGTFDAVIAGVAQPMTFQDAGDAERVRAAALTPNAFTMLGVPARLGRTLREDDAAPGAPPTALVSDAFWRERLGADPSIVGRVVRIGAAQVTIVGVMPPDFRWWDRDVWLPLRLDPLALRTDRRYYVQGRLRPGLSAAQAETQLAGFIARLRADHPEIEDYAHVSVSVHTLLDDVLRELRPALGLLLVAVLLVMAVAAANLSNVVLGRAASREGEFAVRYALGASPRHVLAQLVIENVVIGAVGAAVGLVAATFLLNPVLRLVPYGFIPAEAHVSVDWRVAACATGLSLLLAIVAALIPASRTASLPLSIVLRRNDARTGTRRVSRVRYAFVACQIAMALMLTVASAAAVGALLQSLQRHPGFDPRNAWTARIGEGNPAPVQRVLDVLRDDDGLAVAAVSALPIGPLPTLLASVSGRPTAAREADWIIATPDFERALGMAVREGRGFRSSDGASSRAVCVVSEAFARRAWPDGAIGRQLTLFEGDTTVTATVVGIAADVDARGDGVPRPLVMTALAQTPAPPASVAVVGRGAPAMGLAALRDAIRRTDPAVPAYDAKTLAEARREMLGPRIFAAVLLSAFCVAVLVLSTIGLHTLVAELARQKQRETAIRLALGALPRTLFASELRRGFVLVATAAVATLPAWAIIPALLAPVFEGVRATVWPAAAISLASVSLISLTAIALPAWKASHGTSVVTNAR